MRLADFLTVPCWIMFILGVILSAWVMSMTRTLRSKVSG